jgi:hypothetical protein
MVDRFLERYEARWSKSPRPSETEFANNPKHVRKLLTEWSERKLAEVTQGRSLTTLQANVMFKQLLYDNEAISFGSKGTNWKKKTEIAKELETYKPWSVAHAIAIAGSRRKLRDNMESIIERDSGSSSERAFFKTWWNFTDNDDRPMLFPQVWGHTSGKLWLPVSEEQVLPAFSALDWLTPSPESSF